MEWSIRLKEGEKVIAGYKEPVSFKKAVKSFQGGTKSKQVRVEWEAKKGGLYEKIQQLPYGRSKKIGR